MFKLALVGLLPLAAADCILSNKTLNDEFADIIGAESIPTEGSCCMKDVCGLACPVEYPSPLPGAYQVGSRTFLGCRSHQLVRKCLVRTLRSPIKCSPLLLQTGYGIAVMVSIIISFLVGIATIFLVKGKSVNFFVAGKILPDIIFVRFPCALGASHFFSRQVEACPSGLLP
jgi:hypothetical protein